MSRTYRQADFPPELLLQTNVDTRAVEKALQPNSADRLASVDDLGPNVPVWCKVVIVEGRDPQDPGRYPSRSEAVFGVTCELMRCGVPEGTALSILTNPVYRISESILEQKSRAERYALRQIQRAKEAVAESAANFHGVTDDGKIPPTQKNIRVAIRRLDIQLKYDEFSHRNLISGLQGEGPELNDDALNRLYLLLDEQFNIRPKFEFFLKVVRDLARRNRFHPVRDVLDGLAWDGAKRIDTWLSVYAGAEDAPYTRAVGRLLLLAAVRRIRKPGCKFDEMVIFEGEGGTNKSTALTILAMEQEWFTDSLPLGVDGKQAIELLSGRWFVEIAELQGLKKAGVEGLKAFLSRRSDRGRLAYDKTASSLDRQCIFIGTTNSDAYLTDTTGNRRFWPIKIKSFDLEALKRDVRQLWAEACVYEAAGESIRLDPQLYIVARMEQDKRSLEDPFQYRLEAVLGQLYGKIRTEDVMRIVGVMPGHRHGDHTRRVAEVMQNLGWHRDKRRFGGKNPEHCYVRGTVAERNMKIVLVGADENPSARLDADLTRAPF